MNADKRGYVVLLALALLLSACHKTPRVPVAVAPPPPDYFALGEKYFDSGEYANAAQAYQTYLRGHPSATNQDRALFRLALVHALPASPARDMPRAIRLLQQLVNNFPQSPYRTEADFLLRLQAEVDRLRGDTTRRDERIKELTKEVDKLNRELEKLREIDLQRRPSRVPPQ